MLKWEVFVKRKNRENGQGQSIVGVGKIILWALVVVIVFLLKLCGFDVDYPSVTP